MVMCGRDLCDNGVPCGSLTYFCARPEDVKPDTAHPICVGVCPTSNQTSHICFDQTSGTVALPDAPTVQFNMKCLQQRHLEEENSKHLISRGMERFKEAGSFEGLFMDSAHSIKRAQLLMLYVFLVSGTATFLN
ncbi:unnamed protein product [Effrenium voratum]|nr:unnamed protein product [Effrenium voratum]